MAPVIPELKQAASIVARREIRRRYLPILRQMVVDLVAPELRAIRSVVGDAGDVDAVQRWIEEFYPGNELRIEREARPVFAALGQEVAPIAAEEGGGDPEEVDVETFAAEYAEAFSGRWTRDSVAPVRQILRDEDDQEARAALLVETFEGWEDGRPDTVASREATQAEAAFAMAAFAAVGVRLMVWRANPGACALCQEMDGRTARITGVFLSPGDTLRVRSDDREGMNVMPVDRIIRHPPLHGNRGKGGVCECSIAAV